MATGSGGKIDLTDLKSVTPIGVACFVHVFEPHAFEGGKSNYSLILTFAKGTDLSDLKALCKKAAIRKFGDEEKVMKLVRAKKLQMPWRDGSDYEKHGEPFVEGATFISLKSNNPPGVLDHNKKEILDPKDFYAGCMARASYVCWPYDSMGNQGVTLLLNNVQKTGNGTKLAGRGNAEDDFDVVAQPKGSGKAASKASASDDAFEDDEDGDPFGD